MNMHDTHIRAPARAALFVLAILTVFALMPATCFAEGTNEFSATLHITGEHELANGSGIKTGRQTFVLTSEEEGTPMPEGSAGSSKEVTINPGETFDFGTISYKKPGTYIYTVSRKLQKCSDIEVDNSVYTIKCAVFSDGELVTAIEKSGDKGKEAKIVYTDKYIKPNKDENSKKSITERLNPRTGDEFPVLMVFIIIFISTVIIFSAAKRNKKRSDKDQ